MGSKKQTTMAKRARERRLQEKRQLKAEKKLERKQAALREGEAAGDDGSPPADDELG
jgi:hypothetical protein